MNLTTAFLFLFIIIVIPGFIFLRVYFYGEFSKQFTTKESIPRLLLLSVIPGLLISALHLSMYNWLADLDIRMDHILVLFERLSKDEVSKDAKSMAYFNNYSAFIQYCFFEYLLSTALGLLVSRVLVRWAKLDRKWKILRFKNQWYYVFSGEIFEMKKFKKASKVLLKNQRKTKDILLAKADILIKGAEGAELYTGYVADYDLNPNDISKLDNVYLIDAIRYKTVALESGELNLKNPERTEKKPIPGELFVLNTATMININVSYLLQKEPPQKMKGRVSPAINVAIKIFSILLLLSTTFIFYNPSWINYYPFERFHATSHWYHKLVVFLFCTNLISLINPYYDTENRVHRYMRFDTMIAVAITSSFAAIATALYIFL
jgi:hypothetical protein